MKEFQINRAKELIFLFFSIFISLPVPPGLPRLSAERNVVNVRQGNGEVYFNKSIYRRLTDGRTFFFFFNLLLVETGDRIRNSY